MTRQHRLQLIAVIATISLVFLLATHAKANPLDVR